MPTAALYDFVVPVLIRGLQNMHAFLKKGEQWAHDNDVPVEKLMKGKLAEDMLVQMCSNLSKFVAVRVAGVANEAMEDDETTFEQLYARIDKTIAFLQKVEAKDFEGKEEVEVVVKGRSQEWKFTGLSYVQQWVLPNFFFHESMAYAILRNQGVPVGKLDYLMNGSG
ncbi:hypothetical protein LTR85_001669 [Meristemomyces frigidus]|nr:hypothetical protein LTR85_001669 [Meristemomyces frigidus]